MTDGVYSIYVCKRGVQKIGQGRDAARKRAGAEVRKPALSRVRRGFVAEFVQNGQNLRAKAELAPQAACVHEGGGVERRAAHHERERQRRQREAAGGSTEPAAEEATDVEAVSAADVLAGVEESGPNYALPTAREGQRERRERLRVDETAKQAGHTIVETGTHVEILGEQGLWWPATIAGREEDVDGRLVHEVEYDGYQGEQYWHMLD